MLDITYQQLPVCAICVQENFHNLQNHYQVCPSSGGYLCALQSTAQRERQRIQIAVRQPMLRQKQSTKLGRFPVRELGTFAVSNLPSLRWGTSLMKSNKLEVYIRFNQTLSIYIWLIEIHRKVIKLDENWLC